MSRLFTFTRYALMAASILMFSSCSVRQNNTNQLPIPHIKAGIVKVTVNVKNLKLIKGQPKPVLEFWLRERFTTEDHKYVSQLDENNNFSVVVPLELSTQICSFIVKNDNKSFCSASVGVQQGKELQVKILFDDKDKYTIDVKGGLNLTYTDMTNIENAMGLFEDFHTWGDFYKMTPKAFADNELSVSLNKRIHASMDSIKFSEPVKNFLINDFTLHYLNGRLFAYKEQADKSYQGSKNKDPQFASYSAIEPDVSYYSFLRKYDLNNPRYLYCYFYPEFMTGFLKIAAFKIPEIKDQPIDKWLKGISEKVKDAVGFDSGLFYDMLAATAYGTQLKDKGELLTEQQMANIQSYYKTREPEISKNLLNKNKELFNTFILTNDLKVNPVPEGPKEKIMNAIISKYKGKVVLVDYWATWCGPCINAMNDMKPLKQELKNKGVVFVYFSNTSSPKPLWEGKIKSIGSEHYYFSAGQWEYLMNSFGFEYIPSYLIYDKTGFLKQKITAYPGTDKMRSMLKELL